MIPPPPPDRRAIGVIGAYVEGWRRVLRAPVMCAGVIVVTTITLVALGAVGRDAIQSRHHEGTSVANWNRLQDSIGGRFIRLVIQTSDPLTIAADTADGPAMNLAAAGALTRHVGLWLFLLGGILDRLARDRRVGTAGFFGACGVYFFRFLRLSVPIALAYWAIFRWVQNYLLIYFLAMVAVMLLADFARVRAVVEDRRSMLGALLASFRFVRRHPLDVLGLYVFGLGGFFAFVELSDWLSHQQFMQSWIVWPVGLFVAAALPLMRLALAAAQVVLFQHALAHADYTAAPLPIWPDSPAAEAIENLVQQRERSGPGA
jgi:hypothetical protein